jgi:hypothetical protein
MRGSIMDYKVKAGTLWVDVTPTGDSIPYGYEENRGQWIACDAAYNVDEYVRTIKEYELALEFFDVELSRMINDGRTAGRIELPPHLGGFVFNFSTRWEGDEAGWYSCSQG